MQMMSSSTILAFDIYGTILDTSAVSSALAECTKITSEKAKVLTQEWRKYQLECVECQLIGRGREHRQLLPYFAYAQTFLNLQIYLAFEFHGYILSSICCLG
jgi:hypothetical protein